MSDLCNGLLMFSGRFAMAGVLLGFAVTAHADPSLDFNAMSYPALRDFFNAGTCWTLLNVPLAPGDSVNVHLCPSPVLAPGAKARNVIPIQLGDYDHNGVLNSSDLAGARMCLEIGFFASGCIETFDFNGDGEVTYCDYDTLARLMDPAAADCNGNSVPDACEIEQGTLADVDGNHKADACQIIYVAWDAPSGGNGQAWGSAFSSLDAALGEAALRGGVWNLWVKKGTYRPLTINGFSLVNNVSVYGGFAGTETVLSQRDFRENKTTLSGDIGDNDDEPSPDFSDNARNVILADQVNNTTLDGFIVTRAYSLVPTDEGGGLRLINSSLVIRNCIVTVNQAGLGAGAHLDGGTPTFVNTAFLGNNAVATGAGLHLASGSASIQNCTFAGNKAGFINPTIQGNGGAIWAHNGFSAVIRNCTFSENIISGNPSPGRTGGVRLGLGQVRNSVLWGNRVGAASGQDEQIYPQFASVARSCIQGLGTPLSGNGNTGADPLFVDADGADDVPGTTDDDLRLAAGSGAIDRGDNTVIPVDTYDLDGDGNTTEPLPFDAAGNVRIADDPNTPNMGSPAEACAQVDMGAYEFVSPGVGFTITAQVTDTKLVDSADQAIEWESIPKNIVVTAP